MIASRPLLYLLLSLAASSASGSPASPPEGQATGPASPSGTPSRLAAPGAVETTPLSPTAVRIYWSPPPGAVAGYRIYRDGHAVAETGPEARSYDDNGREPGQNYRYRVAALAAAV